MSYLGKNLVKWKHKEKTPKEEWPELVGKIQIIPQNSFVVKNFEEKRVRLFVDKEQTVVKTPQLG